MRNNLNRAAVWGLLSESWTGYGNEIARMSDFVRRYLFVHLVR